jgi:hypothetical protein
MFYGKPFAATQKLAQSSFPRYRTTGEAEAPVSTGSLIQFRAKKKPVNDPFGLLVKKPV